MARVGMRNIKTAIAVFICIIALESMGIEKPFFACITAIQTMQTDMHTSFQTGIHRFVGTIFGNVIGALFAVVFYRYFPMDVLLVKSLVIPFGIMFIIFILTNLKLNDSILISCVVFLSIMINVEDESLLLGYAVERSFTTTFGVVVAILVNRFIAPYDVNKIDKKQETITK